MHYNFEKFECEVCKTEFPGYVDAFGVHRELLELELPSENYIMLEGACEKEKSIMIIQNTPPEGIKLGRGHECEIRITDISVSRKHAHIRSIGKDFYIFDNKSKFGTLIRENGPLSFELKREKKAIQVGRTIFEFEMFKSNT